MIGSLIAVAMLAPRQALRMPSVFSDGMVLQRGMATPVFGEATPGANVEVRIAGQSVRTKADFDGRWVARLAPMSAGGPYTLQVKAGQTVSLDDVMVGEVWVCSGQSNMEWHVAWAADPQRESRDADRRVRMFTVDKASTAQPAPNVQGEWQTAGPSTVANFSAVGYHFARNLAERLNVTVGMINSSWGGTPAESWISLESLRAGGPLLAPITQRFELAAQEFPSRQAVYEREYNAWRARAFAIDTGNQGQDQGYALTNEDDSTWATVSLPGRLPETFDGGVWFRKVIDVPAQWLGKPMRLDLGPIDDFDIAYFNGHRVGRTGREKVNHYAHPRSYRISPGLVKSGPNLIAIRVWDERGGGGFTGLPEGMALRCGNERISLAGEWRTQVERAVAPATAEVLQQEPARPMGPGNPWMPTSLYNGMIAPIATYGIRGAIWYQGESNADRALQYRTLFPAMIRDWRTKWGQGDFPFYFVQLANFMARKPEPGESAWAELREAQTMTLKLKNTGMAVIIDIGEANDIHPKNKRDVGYRLALLALARDYGVPIVHRSPTFARLSITGAEARVFLDGVGQGLKTSDGGPVKGFAIAGADRKFVWAEARIMGSSVIVSSPLVPQPVAVRYGWADNPEVNLTNMAGLPASPFRTDNWPGVGDARR